jgi:hypothetical protein
MSTVNRSTTTAPAAPSGSSLSQADRSAIQHYTDNQGYVQMNAYLRKGKPSTPAVKRAVAALNAALAKLPPETRLVHRFMSVGLSKEQFDTKAISRFLAAMSVGRTYTEKGFLSTTSNDVPSGKFDDGVTVRIEVRARTAKNVASASQYQAEQEYLLPPGTRFRVLQVKGEMAESYPDGSATNPTTEAWVGFRDAFKGYFPAMGDAEVKEHVNKGKTPVLVVTLEELPQNGARAGAADEAAWAEAKSPAPQREPATDSFDTVGDL